MTTRRCLHRYCSLIGFTFARGISYAPSSNLARSRACLPQAPTWVKPLAQSFRMPTKLRHLPSWVCPWWLTLLWASTTPQSCCVATGQSRWERCGCTGKMCSRLVRKNHHLACHPKLHHKVSPGRKKQIIGRYLPQCWLCWSPHRSKVTSQWVPQSPCSEHPCSNLEHHSSLDSQCGHPTNLLCYNSFCALIFLSHSCFNALIVYCVVQFWILLILQGFWNL